MVDKIERLDVVEQLVTAEHLHSSASKLISLLLQGKGSYDFAFSNVGRFDIPDTYADFRLESFLGVTVALPWRNCTTLVTTQFRGQADLAFVSNQNFLPAMKQLRYSRKQFRRSPRRLTAMRIPHVHRLSSNQREPSNSPGELRCRVGGSNYALNKRFYRLPFQQEENSFETVARACSHMVASGKS